MVFEYQDFVAIVSRCIPVCAYQKHAVPAYPSENVSIVSKASALHLSRQGMAARHQGTSSAVTCTGMGQ